MSIIPQPFNTNYRDAFLALVEPKKRATVTNLFLNKGPRAGIAEPGAVVSAVLQELTRRKSSTYPDIVENAQRFRQIISEHAAEAEAFARYCIGYEELPYDERKAMQAKRGEEHLQRWMENRPASENQVQYLRSLGYDGDVQTMAEASALIDLRTKGRQGR